MRGLRILITNHFLRARTGSELYVCELATSLLRRGHTPIVYSPQLGHTARELRKATVPIVDNLDALGTPPDLIHGQHHVETMSALLRFPNTPAVFFCHGWLPWEETPPKHPRIMRYIAVDDTCLDRLVSESGIPEERVSVILNSVDLEEFLPRSPLPAKPARALVFSNGATHLRAVREACLRHGLTLDVIGADAGNVSARPQDVLGQYDIVFAKARSALEAMAVGSAVVLCDIAGVGPMVKTGELDRLRRLNFGVRTLRGGIDPGILETEIARYDPTDAAEVSQRIRATAGRNAAIDQIIALYREVIDEFGEFDGGTKRDLDAEGRAEAVYLRDLTSFFEAERAAILESRTFRWRKRMLNLPMAGAMLRSIASKFRS